MDKSHYHYDYRSRTVGWSAHLPDNNVIVLFLHCVLISVCRSTSSSDASAAVAQFFISWTLSTPLFALTVLTQLC